MIVIIVALLGSVLWPLSVGRKGEPKYACLSNLKQVLVGQLMYASDHDDRATLASNWMNASLLYVKSEATYRCTAVEPPNFGFAFNEFMSGAKIGMEDSGEKRLVYESRNLKRNVAEYLPLFPVPGRHQGKNNVGFADGHAKPYRMDPRAMN